MTRSLTRALAGWHPEPVVTQDVPTFASVRALSALLDTAPAAEDGRPLPPLWHWLSFLDWPRQADLGPDGHPAAGHFLPPIADRRRMFAGGRVGFPGTLNVGSRVRRRSSLHACAVKEGRSGALAFVTVRSELSQNGVPCVVEELDYVYRSGAPSGGPQPPGAPTEPGPWGLHPNFGTTVLFAFSALTANSHRIHYDAGYATDVEGYPGLVVQGPLQVLLMAELVRRRDRRPPAAVEFRLHRPAFAGEAVIVHGGPADPGTAEVTVDSAHRGRHASMKVTF